jgi:hypothetical protein
MKYRTYQRRGLGEDWLSSHWFCDCLRTARQLLAQAQVQDAEQLVAVISLYALERMETDALAEAMSVLAEILETKGETLQQYYERADKQMDQKPWGFDQAA